MVAPPTVPLSPRSSWGGASLVPLREILTKKYKYKGAVHPRERRGFTPPQPPNFVIEATARGRNKWNEIKRYFENKKKRAVYDAELRRYLMNLEKKGYIVKSERGKYDLTDPAIKSTFNRLTSVNTLSQSTICM
ncbi:hypothetical protein [Sulfodiicoccus acidiphilus]|uniref:hypothetical protein n=1 Tax=Sulfodiicoccus acidiphilus TaxID=1670455 RepID=UPI00131567B4|nr:hypothetical protein [Sulfodiicoccus acidiphilus]